MPTRFSAYRHGISHITARLMLSDLLLFRFRAFTLQVFFLSYRFTHRTGTVLVVLVKSLRNVKIPHDFTIFLAL